jgi:outer membrane protein assembly factor BamB
MRVIADRLVELKGFILLPLLLVLGFHTAAVKGEEWPTWRGPLSNGVSLEATPPIDWSETNHIKWKVALPGSGASSPIVWGNRVFVQAAIPSVLERLQFVLICLDRQTGRTLWQKVLCEEKPHERHHADHGFCSSSPVTDGSHIFAWFGSRGLYCCDMDGNILWQKRFGFLKTKNEWGEGSSPALYKNSITIVWDHEGADFVVSLDKETGEERWRTERDEETGWSTPLVVERNGAAEIIVSARTTRSYDLKSGKQLWECAGLAQNIVPSPVSGNGIVYVACGYGSETFGARVLAIPLGRTGILSRADSILWTYRTNAPYVPSPLLYRGKLYFFTQSMGILNCLDAATGRVLIKDERVEGLMNPYASPVAADGRIYLVGRNGLTAVVNASSKIELLAKNRLDDVFLASPALVEKEIFLRGQKCLYCISDDQ